MLNIGVPEMILILVVALIVFGPNRLPEIARQMGKFIRNFQAETNRAIDDLKKGIEPSTTGIFDEPDPGTPETEPITAAPPASPVAAPLPTRAPVRRRVAAARKKPAAQPVARKKPAAKKQASMKKAPARKTTPVRKKTAARRSSRSK